MLGNACCQGPVIVSTCAANPHRFLACSLAALGWGLFAMDHYSEAIQDLEEAIYIQTTVAKLGQENLEPLFEFLVNHLQHDLRAKR